MTTLLPLLFASLELASAGVGPRKVVEQAVLEVTAPTGEVAVGLPDGSVWAGSGRVKRLGALPGVPVGLHASGGAVTAWSTRREGLCVETTLATWSAGLEVGRRTRGSAPVAASRLASGHAVLWPDQLDLVSASGEVRAIPLPLGRPIAVSEVDGLVQVDGLGGPLLQVDPKTGCPVDLVDDPGLPPLDRMRIRAARRVCEDPKRLPAPVVDEAEASLDVLRRVAIREGDPQALAMLGAWSCDAIEELRPTPVSAASAFSTREERELPADGRLKPQAGFRAIIKDVDAAVDLGPWIEGPMAPACRHGVVLLAESPAMARVLKRRIREARDQRRGCAENLRAGWPGELGPLDEKEEDARAFYLQAGAGWRGVREGGVSARLVRMDLARLDRLDPLHQLSRAPELTPSWSVGPGPGGPLIKDVDGSWVAAAGWDVVRGPPNAIREERTSLFGPVQRLQGRRDGRFEVVAGGQPAQVALENGEVSWADVAADSTEVLPIPPSLPPPPAVDPGPWRITGDGELTARTGKGTATLSLGVPIQRVLNGRLASVAVTPVGLVGVGRDGKIAWKLTELDQWVWTGDFIVGSSPFGVHGFRLPY